MSRRSLIVLVAAVVVAALGVTWYLQRDRAPRAVFLIVVDTLRADRLSCYGYDGHRTAHIDSLAASGVQFDEALSVGGWTVPSMGAMMTSLYPTQLGLIEAPKPKQKFFKIREHREQLSSTIAPGFVTLSDLFSGAGYHTAAFVNQPILNNRRDGFSQGFDEWFYPVTRDTVLRRTPGEPDSGDERPPIVAADVYRADSVIVSAFASWLPGVARQRLFVWVHLLVPHTPYRPPARYIAAADTTPSALYDGEVRYSDDLVGELLASINRHVGKGRSLVVFTADHGEEFGEHGSKEHGHSLHRECVHVPLIVAGPGVAAGGHEKRTVRLIDIFPTLVGVCGLEGAPADVEGVPLDAVAGGGADSLAVYSEGMLYGSTERALQVDGLRLMWDEQGDAYHLYDVTADVMEHHPLGRGRAADVARLTDALVSMHTRLARDGLQRLQSQETADSAAVAEERARALKAMKSLGYVGN